MAIPFLGLVKIIGGKFGKPQKRSAFGGPVGNYFWRGWILSGFPPVPARAFGNLRAVQLLLGHTKLESTVRYLGIEVDDALSISEQVEL